MLNVVTIAIHYGLPTARRHVTAENIVETLKPEVKKDEQYFH